MPTSPHLTHPRIGDNRKTDEYRYRPSYNNRGSPPYNGRSNRGYNADVGASSSRRRSISPHFEERKVHERRSYDIASSSRSSPLEHTKRKHGINSAGSPPEDQEKNEEEKKAQPNFERSGLLAAASSNVQGTALKYHEPPEARLPKKKWRLYVFKDGKEIDLLHISKQSCYLIGRDRTVVDIPVEHPSCSKQHAALQYRQVTQRNDFGDEKRSTKPFLIDLDSANGCSVNGNEVPPSRFYELRNGDTFKLGSSTREYVILAEG